MVITGSGLPLAVLPVPCRINSRFPSLTEAIAPYCLASFIENLHRFRGLVHMISALSVRSYPAPHEGYAGRRFRPTTSPPLSDAMIFARRVLRGFTEIALRA